MDLASFSAFSCMREIRRVLKAGGRLIIEAMRGEKEGIEPDHYASFSWQRVEDLLALLKQEGFETKQRAAFTEPWPGEQICLEKIRAG